MAAELQSRTIIGVRARRRRRIDWLPYAADRADRAAAARHHGLSDALRVLSRDDRRLAAAARARAVHRARQFRAHGGRHGVSRRAVAHAALGRGGGVARARDRAADRAVPQPELPRPRHRALRRDGALHHAAGRGRAAVLLHVRRQFRRHQRPAGAARRARPLRRLAERSRRAASGSWSRRWSGTASR